MSEGQPQSIEALLSEARAAAGAGRSEVAADLWRRVAAAAPGNAEAHFSLGRLALRRGDMAAALPMLARAEALAPKEPLIPLEIAQAANRAGDPVAEFAALERAIAADPYCYPALLFKGAFLERNGAPKDAARIYADALRILPPNAKALPGLGAVIARAQTVVEAQRHALDAFLNARLATVRARHAGAKFGRFEEAKDAAIGAKKIYTQQPTLLHVPQLPAIQYFDDDLFPWLGDLEAATDDMAAEVVALVASESAEFRPYVRFRPGEPVNQWAELNHSPKWSAFFFYENGERIAANCARCPKTAAALTRIPLAGSPGYSPNVFYSTLAAGAHIPPHTGSTNARLIVHLPLIVPEKCAFRVGNDTRDWVRGKAWVFDDTIEHEAWNRSDRTRVILILDVWHPMLSAAERDLINEFLTARREYYAV